jgi:urease accessory protein
MPVPCLGGEMVDLTPQIRMQRSRGETAVSLELRRGQTALADLHQSGSAKAMLPRVPGAVPEIVFLNTSGGLTGGDRISYAMTIGPGCRAVATSQTAERAYASLGPVATLGFGATVGAGGRLDWLPQELLLYEDAHLARQTTVDLATDATVLLVETVVLGRHAMGEAPRNARLTDRRLVRRDGRVIWAETLRLSPDWLEAAASPALLGPARAFSVIALIGPGAETAAPRVRAALTEPGCEHAVSGWDGKCITRLIAHDGWPLRRQVARVLGTLRDAPLPRAWQMQGDSR